MKVCYFGPYDKDYPRNLVIREGLERNGVEVMECCDNTRRIWLRYPKLLLKYLKLDKDYDAMIVPEFGATNVPLAWLLTRMSARPLIFDPFISHYDTNVFDRKLVHRHSWYAKYLYFLDKFSCYLADYVLVQTQCQKNYFKREFGIKEKKIKLIHLGADNRIFYPRENKRKDNNFSVLYFGSYSPMTGIEYIFEAANILEKHSEIIFTFIGEMPKEIKKGYKDLKNISFKGWIEQSKIPDYIAEADICLGIFGDTEKGKSITPNRIFQVLAMRKPLIMGDTPAIREVLKNEENVFLCPLCDSHALAKTILFVKENKNLTEKIADAGYKLYLKKFTPEAIGREFKQVLESIIYKCDNLENA